MPFKFSLVKELNINETEMIYDVKLHPTRTNIAALSTLEGDIQFIDLNAESNSSIMHLKRHHKGSPIRRIGFVNDELLVSAAKTIKLFDLNGSKMVRKIDNGNRKIYSMCVIDNYLLGIGDDEGYFTVWDYRVERGVYCSLKECAEYISDLDVSEDKRIVVASSGEGTLSAFNIRAKKLDPPQSELFDAGFQCVRFMEEKKKVIVGAEDGAINIFNVNEWGNISDRFPIRGDTSRGKGTCSVERMELLDDETAIVGTSDGKLLEVSILPNKIRCKICTHKSSVECLAVDRKRNQIISTHDNVLKYLKFEETEQDSSCTTIDNFFEGLEAK